MVQFAKSIIVFLVFLAFILINSGTAAAFFQSSGNVIRISQTTSQSGSILTCSLKKKITVYSIKSSKHCSVSIKMASQPLF